MFLSKAHSLHARRSVRVPPRWARELSDAERVVARFWEGSLQAREHRAIDSYPFEALERTVEQRFGARARIRRRGLALSDAAARFRDTVRYRIAER